MSLWHAFERGNGWAWQWYNSERPSVGEGTRMPFLSFAKKEKIKCHCDHCAKDVDAVVIHEKKNVDVNGESVKVEQLRVVCKSCGKDIALPEYDKKNKDAVECALRVKNKLLLPEEVANAIKGTEMTPDDFDTLAHWEKGRSAALIAGALQTVEEDKMLRMASNKANVSILRMLAKDVRK